jgi:nitric oxide reductase NorQ protein
MTKTENSRNITLPKSNITLPEMNPDISSAYITKNKFYLPQGKEISLALGAFAMQMPLVIDGPTGTGKSSLVEHLCYLLGKGWKPDPSLRPVINEKIERMIKEDGFDQTGYPQFVIQGHDDLTADDLRGRPYIVGKETMWLNGKALLAARHGGMFYFDEPGEARPDTLVVTHSLSDHRRTLDVEKLGISLELKETTFPVLTYNSKYQDPRKKFKPSTSQRFVYLYLDYPRPELELKIVEGALQEEKIIVDESLRKNIGYFIDIANETRRLASENYLLQEGACPREVINAAKLASTLKEPQDLWFAAMSTLCYPLSSDQEIRKSIEMLVKNKYPCPYK